MKESRDKFGFTEFEKSEMDKVFEKFPDVEKVILFGSRAMGNFKPFSDVDVVLVYLKDDYHIVSSVKYELEEETQLPYFFDVLDLKTITSEELKEHIEREGVEIWKRR